MPPKKDDVDDLREEFRSDVRELHNKTNTISGQISNIDSKLEATLPFLATTTDVEKTMGNHVKEFHGPKSGRSTVPQRSGMDPKLIAGLVGAATLLISALTAVINHYLSSI
ncbi:hypothetical protein GWN42_13535 [candidate division KSB1 bacterium]|nr:hypothetical protein [candidate division KSB1 bacterium]